MLQEELAGYGLVARIREGHAVRSSIGFTVGFGHLSWRCLMWGGGLSLAGASSVAGASRKVVAALVVHTGILDNILTQRVAVDQMEVAVTG